MRPLIIDSFAGGGGASTGIEIALGRSPDIAINHSASTWSGAESQWVGGLAHWRSGDRAYLSVAFTYKLPAARKLAIYYASIGLKVFAGGPAFTHVKAQRYMEDVSWVPRGKGNVGRLPGALDRHNPAATIASRGCDQNCNFCIVPVMEGEFSFLPDFVPRPVLCDNNLSGLPADYQDHIVRRYQEAGVPLLDANSGFEPRSFSAAVFERWRVINRGVWRLAYDDLVERDFIREAMAILRHAGVAARNIQIYTILGNEPFEACMQRVREVIEWGGGAVLPAADEALRINARAARKARLDREKSPRRGALGEQSPVAGRSPSF